MFIWFSYGVTFGHIWNFDEDHYLVLGSKAIWDKSSGVVTYCPRDIDMITIIINDQ